MNKNHLTGCIWTEHNQVCSNILFSGYTLVLKLMIIILYTFAYLYMRLSCSQEPMGNFIFILLTFIYTGKISLRPRFSFTRETCSR